MGDSMTIRNDKESNPKDTVGSDKMPFHLCPETATTAISLALLEGMLKYGRSNWRVVGVRASIYYDALRRHMNSWMEGQDIDQDSGLPHLFKAAACITILIDAIEAGKLNDDRMVKGGYNEMLEKYTPFIKELKEKHKDKNPKHYTIQDNEIDSKTINEDYSFTNSESFLIDYDLEGECYGDFLY